MLSTKTLELIKEILIVDDATSLDYIQRESKAFIEGIPLARLLKGTHVEPAGIVKSRAFAVTQVLC